MPTSIASPRLLARLHRDLKELLEQPYPGVAVFTDDADIRKFCLVLTPSVGPWKDLNLHFDVVLPEDWPSQPPKVSTSVHGINHPNLFGDYICCDLLKPMNWLEKGYSGGYTPALTLRGLFLQFLTFFSTNKVEQDYGGIIEIGDYSTVMYFEERYVENIQGSWITCFMRHRNCMLGCGPVQASQSELEARWGADKRPETITYSSKTASGKPETRKVKDPRARPDRINKVERINERWGKTLQLISQWKCKKCPYGSAELPHVQPAALTGASTRKNGSGSISPPSLCQINQLNDDTLLEIASHLESEAVITFGKAYPRFHALVTTYHILLQREVNCFFLKAPLRDSILGVGIAFDQGPRTFSSDFDWLSMDAFEIYKVRKSIQKRDFEFFLPLAFNRSHFERAKGEIWRRLRVLAGAVQQAEAELRSRQGSRGGRGNGQRGRGGRGGPAPTRAVAASSAAQPLDAVRVVYKIMNNIVVSLMKSCDDAFGPQDSRHSSSNTGLVTASERAIISYCHLMHLLICLSRAWPAVLQGAVARLQSFLKSPVNRTKEMEPDMGELVVVMTLVLIMSPPSQPNGLSWGLMNGPFLQEAITRNVRWVLKDAPALEVMEEGLSNYRIATTFEKSKTSLRLLMFQVTFLDLFISTYHKIGIQALDENYGFPVKELPEKMVGEIKAIYGVESWPGFFRKVRWARALDPAFTKEKFGGMLRDAVKKSEERGYHKRATRQVMENLVVMRRQLEAAGTPAPVGGVANQTQR